MGAAKAAMKKRLGVEKHITPLEPERKQVGRPTAYTPEIGKLICDRVAQGYTVRQACHDQKFTRSCVYVWARELPAFYTMFVRARDLQLDGMEDEILEIADDGTNDWMTVESKIGNSYTKVNDEAVRRSQLRLDARYRLLAARRPQTFGKKLDVTSDGKALNSLGAAMIAAAQEQENMIPPEPEQAPVAH